MESERRHQFFGQSCNPRALRISSFLIVEEVLQRNVKHMINEQFKLFLFALICLPNLKLIGVGKPKTSLKRMIQEIVQLIEEEDPKSKRRKTGKWILFENFGLKSTIDGLGLSRSVQLFPFCSQGQ
jgi:hypothetical protein